MANNTIYPYGTGGQTPAGIPIVNDLVTGGADKALAAEQGKVLDGKITDLREELFTSSVQFWKNSSSASWQSGNIENGTITTSYANRYIIISNFPNGVEAFIVTRTAIDATYKLNIFGSSDGTNYTNVGYYNAGVSGDKTITIGNYTSILLLLWDKPTTERARQEDVVISYLVDTDVLREGDIVDSLDSDATDAPLSANQGKTLKGMINELVGGGTYNLTWVTGDITNTGALNPSYANKSTNFINLVVSKFTIHNPTNYNVKTCCYNASQAYLGTASGVGPNTTTEITPLANTKYIRLCAWDKPSDTVVANISMTYVYDGSLMELQEEINAIAGNSTYNNPVLQQNLADPCVIEGLDGFFYLFFTGGLGNIAMRRTTNFLDWEIADVPFTQQAISDCLSDLGVSSATMWAPEIVKVGDKYNLYCSREANPMVVFQSDFPNFGYDYVGKIITTSNGLSNDNIDACVRYDLDGTLWMFWGSTYGMYRQKLTPDGLTLDPNDTKAHVAGKLLSQDSSRATVFEGAYLLRRRGYWYLFVSAGLYSNYTYCLKVGRSTSLSGTFVDQEGNNMTDGYGTLILSSASGDTLYGPGHNGIIYTDRNNRTYMIYHSHYTGAASSSQRYICFQEMLWDEETGWPYFANGKPQIAGNIKPLI